MRREARDWVVRLTSGEATTADAEALDRWRRTSPAHRLAFAEANRLWDGLRPAAVESKARRASSATEGRLIGRRAVLGGALAASAAGYAVLGPQIRLSLAEMTADFRTGAGQRRAVAFEGGASAQLNTRTSIALLSPRSAENGVEEIELIAGEAVITTAPRGQKSFVVVAEGGRTISTDARFNIRNTGVAVCVACVAGSVEVEHLGRVAKLTANRQLTYTARGLGEASVADLETVTAWQRGLLMFRNDPLAHVIEEINRYRSGRIILLNKALGRQTVLATFHVDRIEEVVPRLQAVFGLAVRTLPGGVVLLS
ncbi:DUF4880 domain-containing protein [Methylosinus sp. Sm6]|uniref:FecR family protein n=1 Tax=Methylosinus sp. Sm6 TaxID=2866948 RepID=UPI00351D62ED